MNPFRVQSNAASLKLEIWIGQQYISDALPRSIERGLIEARFIASQSKNGLSPSAFNRTRPH